MENIEKKEPAFYTVLVVSFPNSPETHFWGTVSETLYAPALVRCGNNYGTVLRSYTFANDDLMEALEFELGEPVQVDAVYRQDWEASF